MVGGMRRFALTGMVVLWAAHLFGVSAQAEDKVCFDTSSPPEAAVAGCTRLISSHRTKGGSLANLYVWRGSAYRRAGEYDRAVLDFDQAIHMDPGSAHAYVGRGEVWYQRHEYARGIADDT